MIGKGRLVFQNVVCVHCHASFSFRFRIVGRRCWSLVGLLRFACEVQAEEDSCASRDGIRLAHSMQRYTRKERRRVFFRHRTHRGYFEVCNELRVPRVFSCTSRSRVLAFVASTTRGARFLSVSTHQVFLSFPCFGNVSTFPCPNTFHPWLCSRPLHVHLPNVWCVHQNLWCG